jgi:predicted nuclease of restriction endonuclease-like (RecB) superfamily
MRIENSDAREWYLKESADQNWSTRALQRQINSLYYERLLMSRDKTPVTEEMREKTEPLPPLPEDFIKDPYVLEFLGRPDAHQFREAELEQAIIGKLQAFMLELGKGFAFVARQQRISTETKDFFIDLVFYNYILKCFLLIDLKTSELTHEDIGKMDMYPVRYCYEYFSLRLRSPIYKGRQLLCWVLQRSEKKIRPAQRRSSAIYRKSPASRTCLLRSVSLSERRDQAREVSQDRLGQALHQGATRRLSHGVYVRVFEDTVKGKDDNPTVGVILCTDKDHTVVKYSVLNESRQIFASKYRLYLPTEEELRIEIERERALAVREQHAMYKVTGE